MNAPHKNSGQLFRMLGLAITLPMIMLSGPVAGYFAGYALAEHFKLPSYTVAVFTVLGLVGSGVQAYRIIRRLIRDL